ncbi:hypothetical protein [Streptomyces sp. NPDC058583]|uniref:hypothetical protein n=1 Tax=Streptomyces sp. NPDC058583 TaxID=3346549 RepID=UPI003663EB9D
MPDGQRDVDALSLWQHDEPVDGLADVAFWGAAAEEAAATFAAPENASTAPSVRGKVAARDEQ